MKNSEEANNSSGRSPIKVAADIQYCENIARAESPISVNGGEMLSQSMAAGAVIGAANGASGSAGTGHTGMAAGLGAIGGALQSGTASIRAAQNIAAMQAYNQIFAKTECLLQKNYSDALIAPPDVLARAETIAAARPPYTSTTTMFDATYSFASSTMLTEAFKHDTGRCDSVTTVASPLTIENGTVSYQVRYLVRTGDAGAVFGGVVDAQGRLSIKGQLTIMRTNSVSEISGYGNVRRDGSINMRLISWYCDQDLVWQKRGK